ncbi:ABC transporter substrate-binding protein [Arthrobacter sp. MMS18-M83]|uniref:ABC transporter substrate-binding protein n=1 Tax=Arthrobacter sp. MMS18-M83 TaxID=2996261 RepID=UPI00227D28E2|nr:ABC transporter substrate-binding protein [Arthrobacter sp. MMS18-M83]WAH97294.1 ABC transporter substrate-binding protein [Arthrobacter sp. MMS18-M83]
MAAAPWDLADAAGGNNEQQYQPVYDTLLHIDPAGKMVPNLAESWSYSADQKTLTLQIRGGQKFTDGEPVNGEAVKASLLRAKNGTNIAASDLQQVTEIASSENKVDIKLNGPDPALLTALGKLAGMVASPKALVKPEVPVGSGPYKLDTSATTAGSQYTFVRSPDYWNAGAYPYDTVVIKPIPDPSARFNALVSGQVDSAIIPPARVDPAQKAGMNITSYIPGDVEGLYIWDRTGTIVPALANVKVRQAINYAFDRVQILKTALKGQGVITTQMFNRNSTAFDAALNAQYAYDPAKAKQLMAEAGYPNGFEVTIPDLSAQFPEQQAAINQSLADIGIRVKLVPIPLDQLFTSLMSGKYAMSYFKLQSNAPWDTVKKEFLKSGGWNPFKYVDPKAQDLIDRAQLATGPDQDRLFKQLNAYIVDQAWNAPWDALQATYASISSVKITEQPYFSNPPLSSYKPAQ